MSTQKVKRNKVVWGILVISSIITFCLGYVGFKAYFAAVGEVRPPLSLIYLSLQLFTMSSGGFLVGKLPPLLELARWIAPAITSLTLFQVLVQNFHEAYKAMKANWYSEHVVICGLGEKALHYVKSFIINNKVIVIEQDAENDRILTAQRLGAHVLIGDARQKKVLDEARVANAKYLIVLTGNDFSNIEITRQAREISERKQKKRLDCYTHIVDPLILEVCKLDEDLWTRTNFIPHMFSIYRDAARAVFERSPLDGQGIQEKSDYYAHLIIIGFGRMGENILLQAARVGHFANGKKLKITVVDRQAKAKLQSFKFRYPNLEHICDINPPLNIEADDEQVINVVKEICSDKNAIVTMAVCLKNDEISISYASGMVENTEGFDFPILVRISQGTPLSNTLYDKRLDQLGKGHKFVGFGSLDKCCTEEHLIGEVKESLAQNFHKKYREYLNSDPVKNEANQNDTSLQEWDKLQEDLRESNRQFVDHIPIKMRAIGCDFEFLIENGLSGDNTFSFKEGEVEILSKMEHNRWNAERWLSGWRKGPKDKLRKISPYLVKWEELTEEIKDYDRNFIRALPHLIKIKRR